MNSIMEMREKYGGKTVLLLDGSQLGVLAIEKARAWGIRTIVAHKGPTSPGKQVCDMPVDLDFSDIDKVEKLIRKEKIDGVMAGWTDSHLPKYASICERIGFPAYGTKEQFELFTQKKLYKKLLSDNGIPVVEGYDLDDDFSSEVLETIQYPVLVKPSDGSGSRGIRVCYNPEELREGYYYAKQFSACGDVITERYLTGDEIVAFWLIQDGEATLTALGNWHKKRYYGGVNAMGIGYTFPSIYLSDYERDIAPRIKQVLQKAGVQNGVMFFQSFIENGVSKVYDIGFRLTGTLEFKIVDALTGVDTMERMLEFALSGSMGRRAAQYMDPHFGKEYGWNISFLIKPGTIGEILGKEKILKAPGVIDAVLNHSAGDTITEAQKGNLTQVVMRVLGHSDSLEQMHEDIKYVHSLLSVRSATGEEMLLPPEDIRQYYNVVEKKNVMV